MLLSVGIGSEVIGAVAGPGFAVVTEDSNPIPTVSLSVGAGSEVVINVEASVSCGEKLQWNSFPSSA